MKKVLIITGISLLTFVIVVILLNSMSGESNKKKINDYVTEQGYKTSDDSLFYQRIVSNNTLDDEEGGAQGLNQQYQLKGINQNVSLTFNRPDILPTHMEAYKEAVDSVQFEIKDLTSIIQKSMNHQ